MPTYLFRCHRCAHHFEVNLPFGSKATPLCPQCSHKKTHKVITPPAVHFKGTGFFKTDSQKKAAPEKKPVKPTSEPQKGEAVPPTAPKAEEKKPPPTGTP